VELDEEKKWIDVAGNYRGYHVFGIDENNIVWFREGIENPTHPGRYWS
jgi:hypothetical protein